MRDRFRLDGHTVAVIGAGAGIGEAVARVAAQQGARVACLDINATQAANTADGIIRVGARAISLAVDIADTGLTERALAEVARWGDGLHGVVCTPGINVRKPILEYTDEEVDRVLRINVKGNFTVLRAAGRLLCERGTGSIVLFSSIRSQVVEPGQSVYAATKAAIVQMARAAAVEFAPKGVRVNAVAPGVVETLLTAPIKAQPDWYDAYAAKTALKRWAHPDEMAWPTAFLLSDAASYITGSVLVVDGGWLAIDGRFEPPGMAH